MRRFAVVLIVAALTVLPAPKVAAIDIDKGELLLLPELCRYTQLISSNNAVTYGPEAARFVEYMGQGYWAMHHYCWGLVRLMRSDKLRVTAQERKFGREQAINEFDYVLHHTEEAFIMRPDLLAKKGEVLRQLSRYRDAAESFREAIALRPKYEAAYYGLAETLWLQGQSAEALATLDEGVTLMPDARFLPKLRERIVAAKKR